MAVMENLWIIDCPADKEPLEYHSSDGAWYDIDLSRHGDRLFIKYQSLSSTFNEVYEPGKFEAGEDVNRFRDRFRPSSVQVQDNECRKVIPGLKVCASYSFADNDLRFYDAIVDKVYYKEHSLKDGEEQCRCSFTLSWQDGPNAAKLTTTGIKSICFLQDRPLDQTLVDFVKMCRREVMSSLKHSRSHFSVPINDSNPDIEPSISNLGHESTRRQGIAQHRLKSTSQQLKDPEHAKRAADVSLNLQGRCHYVLAIENLEKDISASTVIEFIHKETTVSPEALVFPSLKTDLYTRGILKVHTEREFSKLLEFLENSDHIVVSSCNRPWVVTERFIWQDDKSLLGNTMQIIECCRGMGPSSELKVIYPGTDEYVLAKERKENFAEFHRDQKLLFMRLAFEEDKILRQSGKSRSKSRR